jgi:hypothetical protein
MKTLTKLSLALNKPALRLIGLAKTILK